ncbi:RbsD/FucU domain-containing protein [Bradyrhizobium zhanjiangense]|uniref:RbsD/FucU domain-containing protein n=1 Tax=Bradyrhizobium zhanjiangense TaxID=1325107 RepID=UPI0023ED089B|nr:RbsD/FucU domain-containing protein [Bradyrhizobium zhanjiangense]
MSGRIVHHVLKSIDPILAPELLWLLASMGHGDDLFAVDANHPATPGSARSA